MHNSQIIKILQS